MARYIHKTFTTIDLPHVTFPIGDGRGQVVRLRGTFPHRFEMQVPAPGGGGGTRAETFEWRRTRGKAVRQTGKRSGYKLVRLATDAGVGGGAVATGGGEVMAAFTVHRVTSTWSSKAGVFVFQGSGAQGLLGWQWQLMAIVTAVGIWNHNRAKVGTMGM